MKLIERKYLFANVADCSHTNYGNFRVTLPTVQEGRNLVNRLYIKKAIIPYNWKRVTSTTKTITKNGTIHFTLTEGNPTIIDLIDELTTLFVNEVDFTFNKITSRFSFHNHNQNQTMTLATTAWEMLGFANANPVTIPAGTIYECPNPVDVRPTPIIEIRVDCTTAGQEVISGGDIQDTPILAGIAMNVPVYSHKVWIDDAGLYFADVTNEHRDITFKITSPDGTPIVPQSSPYFILGVDTYRDDERELLDTQKEALKLQQYSMILNQK